MEPKPIRIQAKIPERLHRAVKAIAAQEGLTLDQIYAERILPEYLAAHAKQKEPAPGPQLVVVLPADGQKEREERNLRVLGLAPKVVKP